METRSTASVTAVWVTCGISAVAAAQTPSFTFVTSNTTGQGGLNALSADGQTAGGIVNGEGFLWTRSGGTRRIDEYVFGLSAEGTTAVGSYFDATRYRGNGPSQNLGRVNHWQYARASAVSGDGNVVAGTLSDTVAARGQGFIWTQATGMVGLGSDFGPFTQIRGMTRDGTMLVGSQGRNAVTWTQLAGFRALPSLGPNPDEALAVTPDGAVIVGQSGNDLPAAWINNQISEMTLPPGFVVGAAECTNAAGGVIGGLMFGQTNDSFVWSAATGTLRANDFFALNGVTIPSGRTCNQLSGISDDGMTFAGGAFELASGGHARGFVVTIPSPGSACIVSVGLSVFMAKRCFARS